jgi:hypothetical protein
MKRITIEYLAKLGVAIFINGETGFLEAQRIDNPEDFAFDMQLPFTPPSLNSDDEAIDILFSLDEIMLNDETLSQDDRETIGEDCYEVLVNF